MPPTAGSKTGGDGRMTTRMSRSSRTALTATMTTTTTAGEDRAVVDVERGTTRRKKTLSQLRRRRTPRGAEPTSERACRTGEVGDEETTKTAPGAEAAGEGSKAGGNKVEEIWQCRCRWGLGGHRHPWEQAR